MDITVIAPCKDCKDRELGCHGKCERYQSWANDRERVRETERKEKEKYNIARYY